MKINQEIGWLPHNRLRACITTNAASPCKRVREKSQNDSNSKLSVDNFIKLSKNTKTVQKCRRNVVRHITASTSAWTRALKLSTQVNQNDEKLVNVSFLFFVFLGSMFLLENYHGVTLSNNFIRLTPKIQFNCWLFCLFLHKNPSRHWSWSTSSISMQRPTICRIFHSNNNMCLPRLAKMLCSFYYLVIFEFWWI